MDSKPRLCKSSLSQVSSTLTEKNYMGNIL